MRKVCFAMAVLGLAMLSCDRDTDAGTTPEAEVNQEIDMSDFYVYAEEDNLASRPEAGGKSCYSMQMLKKQLDKDPGLYQRMYDIEKELRTFIASKKPDGVGNGNGNGNGGDDGGSDPVDDGMGTITIPVVVHVIYSNSQENISDAQINSQIQVLNNDFSASNNDITQVPAEFEGVVADSDIQFTLADVIRKSSTRTSWGTNDDMKHASEGGSDVVDPSTYLNIWVCNIGGGILGYAQFPGGDPDTDGVVISPQFFGSQGYVQAPFDKGRTATHEVGHWINLRHIWGDGRCNRDDFVADTPTSDRPNYGCPSYPTAHCRSNDMTMNYMDYVDDACMYMFSEGQKTRMRAIFAPGGARDSFVQ
ncbi:zinc metalloprotease [Sinomicrobium kalidii]|uniref:zinc metalloprotease n=1 Tax=Sinomicrobium kalidii TaxID=2900738 RepID=UPI001E301ED3|nr:zinc metalloprotease [Sinomicrobium kalidii]UGU18232.1 zinc metalloprotease [Sinomicrobium kalidii]